MTQEFRVEPANQIHHRTKLAFVLTTLIAYIVTFVYVKYWQVKIVYEGVTIYQFLNVTVTCPPNTPSSRCLFQPSGIGTDVNIIQRASFDLAVFQKVVTVGPLHITFPFVVSASPIQVPWFQTLFGGSLPVYSTNFGSLWGLHTWYFALLPLWALFLFVALRSLMKVKLNEPENRNGELTQ